MDSAVSPVGGERGFSVLLIGTVSCISSLGVCILVWLLARRIFISPSGITARAMYVVRFPGIEFSPRDTCWVGPYSGVFGISRRSTLGVCFDLASDWSS